MSIVSDHHNYLSSGGHDISFARDLALHERRQLACAFTPGCDHSQVVSLEMVVNGGFKAGSFEVLANASGSEQAGATVPVEPIRLASPDICRYPFFSSSQCLPGDVGHWVGSFNYF